MELHAAVFKDTSGKKKKEKTEQSVLFLTNKGKCSKIIDTEAYVSGDSASWSFLKNEEACGRPVKRLSIYCLGTCRMLFKVIQLIRTSSKVKIPSGTSL